MAKATVTLVYDGPVLLDGRMDVRELAPALLSMGQLFEAANKVLNEDTAKISVHVVATQAGSFEIKLDVIQTLASQISAFLAGQEITAVAQFAGIGDRSRKRPVLAYP